MKLRYASKGLTCFVIFALTVAVDYFTGYEVTSFPLYLLPIMITYFYFGRWGGYGAVLLATALWLITDVRSGHVYVHEVARYWNGSARLIIYGLFVYGLSLYSKTVQANRQRLEELRALIPICYNCGKIFAADGTWRPIEEAVKQSVRIGGECPDCLAAEVNAK